MFKFKNKSPKELKLVCEEELNLLSKSAYDSDNKYYKQIEGPLKFVAYDKNKLDEILAWLDGTGELEFNGRITNIYFFDTIPIKRLGNLYSLETNFKRDPFWYLKEDPFLEYSNEVENIGSKESYPLIRLQKTTNDVVDITINDVRFKYTFPQNEDYVIVDCDLCNAYYDGFYRNQNLEIDFQFPCLHPGLNNISINEGAATIKIKRKDCFL